MNILYRMKKDGRQTHSTVFSFILNGVRQLNAGEDDDNLPKALPFHLSPTPEKASTTDPEDWFYSTTTYPGTVSPVPTRMDCPWYSRPYH